LTDTNFEEALTKEIESALSPQQNTVTNWAHIRRIIADTAGRYLSKKFRTRPLILPVVIEV
jgi:mRNA degradation ribonuclease J1/J2